ncbi:hypothetical protein GCM10025857_17090 [Alicyclobacillus contaminans]|nr:hypothetical protein GCM10025857_17090 [Alicyclobacillus contaminans]
MGRSVLRKWDDKKPSSDDGDGFAVSICAHADGTLELTPLHINDLYKKLRKKDKPLSNRYINQIHNLLHDAFDRAMWFHVTSLI